MMESRYITLGLGNVSLSETLKNAHVLQMAVLHRLTGEAIFDEYQDKWERQITPLNYLFVQLMYRVKPRLERLRCMWHGTGSS